MSLPTPEVVTPDEKETDDLAKVLNFIEAREAHRGATSKPTLFLSGVEEHERVELTEQLSVLLKQITQALSAGQSISILTRDQEVSTQQAADILGLSRPTVVKLINDGDLPAHVPGSVRRKLRLNDVLAYREVLRARRNEFITETSEMYADADEDLVAQLLAEARNTH